MTNLNLSYKNKYYFGGLLNMKHKEKLC